MNAVNPYNCTKPGNLFAGYDRLLQQLINGFRDGNSFALIGGRRCGKTSLLFQLQKELDETNYESIHPLSRYFDIQALDQISCEILFEEIYSLTVSDIEAEPWQCDHEGKPYQTFLSCLDKVKTSLEKNFGPDWVVILLIDELDAAIHSLPDDHFFQNLRNLLMTSRFHRHFRLVASGVNDLTNLISSGSSPLNNLRAKYLNILTIKQARQLISFGFPDFDDDLEQRLLRITGRHPYLLQGLLEKLWTNRNNPDLHYLKLCVREFLHEHNDFNRWIDAFGLSEHAVYQTLSKTPDGSMHVRDLKNELESSFSPQLDDALRTLGYHGVIDDSDPDEPQIAGTMFRDWYQDNVSITKEKGMIEHSSTTEAAHSFDAPSKKKSTESEDTTSTRDTTQNSKSTGKIKILFLGANPNNKNRLAIDKEFNEIKRALIKYEHKDRFVFDQHGGVTLEDLPRYLMHYKPDIVHFSGHGSKKGLIYLEDDQGMYKSVPFVNFIQIFRNISNRIQCAILNACESEQLAYDLAEDINCVIGMSTEILDEDARKFSIAFYEYLASGQNVKKAFDGALGQITSSPKYEQIPKLKTRICDPANIYFV
ncbi:MAG: CHAT domain-containing protein [Candidatus Lokiarchaeota archaeon]|nr:CHAT domain-containing protein [Candidatus Lokiarchaeota archaeon]